MEKIMAFFNNFLAGEFGYSALKDAVVKFDSTVAGNPDMVGFVDFIRSFASIIPFIMMASMLLIALFGKKLLPVVKFISSFAVGFGLGVYYISPIVADIVSSIPAWVSGLIVGILAALIYRLVYVLFFAAFALYGTYTLCFWALGDLLGGLGDLKGYIFLAVAAVVMIVAFILRKYVEMLGTAALGGQVLSKLLAEFLAIEFLIEYSWILMIVIALLGFFVQVKTRKRY